MHTLWGCKPLLHTRCCTRTNGHRGLLRAHIPCYTLTAGRRASLHTSSCTLTERGAESLGVQSPIAHTLLHTHRGGCGALSRTQLHAHRGGGRAEPRCTHRLLHTHQGAQGSIAQPPSHAHWGERRALLPPHLHTRGGGVQRPLTRTVTRSPGRRPSLHICLCTLTGAGVRGALLHTSWGVPGPIAHLLLHTLWGCKPLLHTHRCTLTSRRRALLHPPPFPHSPSCAGPPCTDALARSPGQQLSPIAQTLLHTHGGGESAAPPLHASRCTLTTQGVQGPIAHAPLHTHQRAQGPVAHPPGSTLTELCEGRLAQTLLHAHRGGS